MIANKPASAVVAACALFGLAACGTTATSTTDVAALCNPLLDSTGEPVEDSVDRVVTHAGTFPCPPPEPVAAPVPVEPTVFALEGDLLFEFDKSVIRPQFYPELNAIADQLNEDPDAAVRIAGHTDAIGTESYNQGLSERRALAVAEYLEERGVDRSRMNVIGFGESQPVATNETPEGRQQNRRVEIVATLEAV